MEVADLVLSIVVVILVLFLLYLSRRTLHGCPNQGCYLVEPNSSDTEIPDGGTKVSCDSDECPGPHWKAVWRVENNSDHRGFVEGYKPGYRSRDGSERLAGVTLRKWVFDCKTCSYQRTGTIRTESLYRECHEDPC